MVSEALTNASPSPYTGGRVHRRKDCRGQHSSAERHRASDRVRGAGYSVVAGQVVQALVLELIESDVFRLQLPQAVVDVRSDLPLDVGSTITLAVKTGGSNAKLVIYSEAPAASGQRVPGLAGRQPIGEAVIIARAPAGCADRRAHARFAWTRNRTRRTADRCGRSRDAETSAPSPRAVTPEQAVGEAVRVAATRQSGLPPCSPMSSRRRSSQTRCRFRYAARRTIFLRCASRSTRGSAPQI
jgi:hypothetical protein